MSWNGWRLVWGALLVIVGGVWLWDNLGIGLLIPLGALWPFLLIALGVYILLRQSTKLGARADEGMAMDRILGDIRLGGPGWQAQNNNIFTVIGDVDVDLRQSTIPDGETTIHVRSLIGDIDVIAPADVAVFAGASVVIGELRVLDQRRDGFFLDLTRSTPDYATARRKLRIEVDTLIGDAMIMRAA
jgi:lia operon protein LiaF